MSKLSRLQKKTGGDFNTYIKAMNNSSDPIWHAGQLLNKGLDSVGIGKGINNILLWTVKKNWYVLNIKIL